MSEKMKVSPVAIAAELLRQWDSGDAGDTMNALAALPPLAAAAVAVEMFETLRYDRRTHPRQTEAFRRALGGYAVGQLLKGRAQ